MKRSRLFAISSIICGAFCGASLAVAQPAPAPAPNPEIQSDRRLPPPPQPAPAPDAKRDQVPPPAPAAKPAPVPPSATPAPTAPAANRAPDRKKHVKHEISQQKREARIERTACRQDCQAAKRSCGNYKHCADQLRTCKSECNREYVHR